MAVKILVAGLVTLWMSAVLLLATCAKPKDADVVIENSRVGANI